METKDFENRKKLSKDFLANTADSTDESVKAARAYIEKRAAKRGNSLYRNGYLGRDVNESVILTGVFEAEHEWQAGMVGFALQCTDGSWISLNALWGVWVVKTPIYATKDVTSVVYGDKHKITINLSAEDGMVDKCKRKWVGFVNIDDMAIAIILGNFDVTGIKLTYRGAIASEFTASRNFETRDDDNVTFEVEKGTTWATKTSLWELDATIASDLRGMSLLK